MKLMRYLLPLLVALGFTASALHADSAFDRNGDEARFNEELNERDWDALQDYINTKRTINVAEKANNLTISGDVRTEWRHIQEKRLGRTLRGGGRRDKSTACHFNSKCFSKCLPISRNVFDVEANLYVEYRCDSGWAVTQLQFDDSMGIDGSDVKCRCAPEALHGSGFGDSINLKRAYLGYNVFAMDGSRFDIEIGRRPLYTIFDSEVEFLNRFDGILLKYDSNCECIADWYVHAGAFVVDQRVDHFAFVAELGLLDICDSGFDFKYSFIDWKKHWWNNGGKNRCNVTHSRGSNFNVSQFLGYYHLDPSLLCAPAQFYGAVLWNTAATRGPIYDESLNQDVLNKINTCSHHSKKKIANVDALASGESDSSNSNSNSNSSNSSSGHRRNHKRQNFAWYAGFLLGEVVSEGDWSFDVQYQYVEARAIPDEDVSGIGRGNVLNESLYQHGRGNTNYKGWRLQALYAVTDNLNIDARVQWSTQIKKSIGGQHSYSEYRIQTIYAF